MSFADVWASSCPTAAPKTSIRSALKISYTNEGGAGQTHIRSEDFTHKASPARRYPGPAVFRRTFRETVAIFTMQGRPEHVPPPRKHLACSALVDPQGAYQLSTDEQLQNPSGPRMNGKVGRALRAWVPGGSRSAGPGDVVVDPALVECLPRRTSIESRRAIRRLDADLGAHVAMAVDSELHLDQAADDPDRAIGLAEAAHILGMEKRTLERRPMWQRLAGYTDVDGRVKFRLADLHRHINHMMTRHRRSRRDAETTETAL